MHREATKNGLNWASSLGERLYCGQLGSPDSRNLVQSNSTTYYFHSVENEKLILCLKAKYQVH